ncbi:MAG: hypothetical protein E7231_05475 [Cellulosilyticum sp.]|nr:hypothetical protein [Cellulosilyticum sp.]
MKYNGQLGDHTSNLLVTNLMAEPYSQVKKTKSESAKKIIVKKVKHNKQNEQRLETDPDKQDEHKRINQGAEDIKGLTANRERKRQFEQVESRNKQEIKERGQEVSRLKEAMMLAEILSEPKCKIRRNRRIRRE